MDKRSVSGRSVFVFLALGLIFISFTAPAQPPSGVFVPGAERYLTYFGHNNDEVRIIDTDGRVTVLNRAELRRIHPVVPGPPRPEAPPAPEKAETIVLPPALEEVDFGEAGVRGELADRMQRQLSAVAVPRLPELRAGRVGTPSTRRALTRRASTRLAISEVGYPDLGTAEREVLRGIGSDLAAQARPVLPKPFLFGPNAPRGRETARAGGILLADDAQAAKRSVKEGFAERVVPRLPQSTWAEYERSARHVVPRRGVPASRLQAPLPLHLLQQPAPQLPDSVRKRAARIRVSK